MKADGEGSRVDAADRSTHDSTAELRSHRLERLRTEPMVAVGQRSSFRGSVAATWEYRGLLRLLVRRELRARYKGSSLGFVWSLLKPIAQLLIYLVIVGQVMQLARGIPDFAIFVFSGLTIWTLFNEIVTGGTGSVVANSGLVKKVYFPREIFPLSSVGAALVNFSIQFGVLVLGTAVTGAFPLHAGLGYAALALPLVIVFGLAVSLLLSALNVYYRDIQHLVEIVMLVLFWASPIVYSYAYVNRLLEGGWLEELYLSNPVTIAVLSFQHGMWTAGADEPFPDHMPMRVGIAGAVSILLLWLAQRVFARLEGNFAAEL